MFCRNCGTELMLENKYCSFCGMKVEDIGGKAICKEEQTVAKNQQENEKNYCEDVEGDKVYRLQGVHRDSKLTFKYFPSEITVCGVTIRVKTQIGFSKIREEIFIITDIEEINFKILPIWLISDVFRLIVFTALLPLTVGFSIFAIIFTIKMMCCRHLIMTLVDGKKVLIPLRQDSDAIPFLQEIGYPQNKIHVLRSKQITENAWRTRELVVFVILLAIAATAISSGVNIFSSLI